METVVEFADGSAGTDEPVEHDLEMFGARVVDLDVALRHHCRHRERAGDDAVWHGGMRRGRQCSDALDLDRRTTGAVDLRTHALQHPCEIDDLGLARGVVDDGGAACEHAGHHQVLGRTDAGEVEPHRRTDQPPRRTGDQETVLAVEFGAELLQPGHVQVEAARTDVVAAGQRDPSLAAPGEQRPEHSDRCAQSTDQVVVGLVTDSIRDVEGQPSRRAVDIAPQAAQQARP